MPGMYRISISISVALSTGLLAASAQAADRKPPYWASIAAGEARMRTGPAKTYPATWLYKRRNLPILVVATYPGWRKVRDPAGTEGWLHVGLLSDARTAIVAPGATRTLHAAPGRSAVVYRVQPGVVGRVSKCNGNWCRFVVEDRGGGFIRVADIWGLDRDERID